ncbi:ARL14 effector protein-like [Aethina tumida]|uniref:ARL14 effector protein-like n=1 Tax=Aethina tumida TaxID=116153 RepID=UPI002147A855|nr:ARL14 effector protein-like [Aethina tumida]
MSASSADLNVEKPDAPPNPEIATESTAADAGPSTSTATVPTPTHKYNTRSKNKKIEGVKKPPTMPVTNGRKTKQPLFDKRGVHIKSGTDLCDCLIPDCVGCFFDCPKCGSPKCGTTCRVNRKFIVTSVEVEGNNYKYEIENTLQK